MSHHRRRPSHRKARNPKASWLITGGRTLTQILHHGQTAYLQPVQSGDHRKRYQPGQRLSVKPYIPGPTDCHVILTGVRGPSEPFTLGDVDYAIARELGYFTLNQFRLAWVEASDEGWCQRWTDKHGIAAVTAWEDDAVRRFEQRWAPKLAWLLHFRIDTTAAPRLLAARSDELYVENDAMALRGEMPALTEDDWEKHIGSRSRYRAEDRLAQRRAEREARGWQDRLQEARRVAKAKGSDIRDECRRFERLMEQGKTEKAMRQLALIEARTFPVAA